MPAITGKGLRPRRTISSALRRDDQSRLRAKHSLPPRVAHGVPTGYRLRDGDLVSIDCGAELDGWTGDAPITFAVGTLPTPIPCT